MKKVHPMPQITEASLARAGGSSRPWYRGLRGLRAPGGSDLYDSSSWVIDDSLLLLWVTRLDFDAGLRLVGWSGATSPEVASGSAPEGGRSERPVGIGSPVARRCLAHRYDRFGCLSPAVPIIIVLLCVRKSAHGAGVPR